MSDITEFVKVWEAKEEAARKRAEYWKAEHKAGNEEIDRLRLQLAEAQRERDEARAQLAEAHSRLTNLRVAGERLAFHQRWMDEDGTWGGQFTPVIETFKAALRDAVLAKEA